MAKGIIVDQNQHITKEQAREFFIQTPAFVDFLPLTPHQFRLYSHYLRVCGDNGECWESVRTTAKLCGLGLGTVPKARSALIKIGLIYESDDSSPRKSEKTIHIKIRDVWEINSQFLVGIRRYGMPEFKAAQAWLVEQLTTAKEELTASPVAMPEDQNDYFKVKNGCSPDEHGVHSAREVFTGRAPCSPDEHGVHSAREVFTGRAPCSPDELNKISYIDPSSQIPDNQIPLSAAAAADGTSLVQENWVVDQDLPPENLDPSTRIGDDSDLLWWGGRVDQWVSRGAVESVCLDYMSMDEWRDTREIVESSEQSDLFSLLLWLRYSSWNYDSMMENGIRSIPAYIRSCHQAGPPPQTSQRDIDTLLSQIEERTAGHRMPELGVNTYEAPASMMEEELAAFEQPSLIDL